MTRIFYVKTKKEHILVSNKNIVSQKTGAQYTVKLDLENVTYRIQNVRSRRTYDGGERITHLTALKRAVRDRLKKLGVVFDLEIRNIERNKEDA